METILCIDAGHGGEQSGATRVYDGKTIYEKDINLKIALLLEKELQKYQNIKIIQTRTEDTLVGLIERNQIAIDNKADYLISLHNNAAPNPEVKAKGCMLLSTSSHYQPKESKVPSIYESSKRLSLSIVSKLQNLGIHVSKYLDQGIYFRLHCPAEGASSTLYYPDGSVADYYSIVRNGVISGIPSIIVEHAYLDNEEDYRNYLETDEKLSLLAKADAEGIAMALELTKKNEYKEEIYEERENLTGVSLVSV